MDHAEFLDELRQWRAEGGQPTGPRANKIAEEIMNGHLHLGEVREQLMSSGEADVVDALNGLVDLIEPYLQEDVSNE